MNYHRAIHNNERREAKEFSEHMNRLFGDFEIAEILDTSHSRSALQKLAWAFNTHNWQLTKDAAFELANEIARGQRRPDDNVNRGYRG